MEKEVCAPVHQGMALSENKSMKENGGDEGEVKIGQK